MKIALLGAEILLAPHQTGGCYSVSPRGMKPVDQEIWAGREQEPAAELEVRRLELVGQVSPELLVVVAHPGTATTPASRPPA